ncbi:thioredoxin [Clostridium aestuarii]|uniref:Thioredoxin n=1 Tax=Clostridium aestuarii TaxID=338193 RepID=A0ABT4D0I6_9CLOT|nr:thioredoxin [Clostridium aestuarii]MCY6484753.1 thioredoxin [Clostridium aestuarii]
MIKEISTLNFKEEVLSTDKLVVADFWAPWCGPCRMVGPIIEELSKELGEEVKFVKINIDANGRLADTLRIESIPTIMIIKDGKVKKKIVGFKPKNQLLKSIKKVLK